MKIASIVALLWHLWCALGKEEENTGSRGLQTKQLRIIGNNGSPHSGFPLGECEGDCDNDKECESGLVCYQRSGDEPVPGCSGSDDKGLDFCIRKGDQPSPSPPSSLTYRGNDGRPSSVFPLGCCQGDCDHDSDCQGSLRCFQRSDYESVPGCSGRGDRGTDYCYDPNNRPSPPSNPTPSPPTGSDSLRMRGDNGSPSSAFPLGRCEGDCDRDSDCQGSLKCFQRSEYQSVPGCSGSGERGKDYCYDPDDRGDPGPNPSPPPPPSGSSFLIKLYWEQGYFWQEETRERRWCWKCRSSRCSSGDSINLRWCGRNDLDRFEFIRYGGGQVQIRAAGTNNCVELVGNRDVRIRNCSSGNIRQRFTAGNGDFDGRRWELIPAASPGCLSQQHHPKDGEIIFKESCELARKFDTSYFNKY